MMKRRAAALALVLGLALAPVSWWLIGDLSSPGFDTEDLDFMVRTPAIIERNTPAAAAIGVAIAALALLSGAWMYLRRSLSRRSLILVGAGAGFGAFLGLAARTITAGGIGANIGAGLVILFGLPGAITGLVLAFRAATGPESLAIGGEEEL